MIMMVPKDGGEPARRLYSIVSPPEQTDSFDLLIKLIEGGVASSYVLNLKTGDEVTFQGPAGLFHLRDTQQNKVFLTTGCGLAPIRSMIVANIEKHPADFLLFWGVPKLEDVYFLDELKALSEKYPNFHFLISLSRESSLDKVPGPDKKYFMLGHVNTGFEQRVKEKGLNINELEYYLCGSRNVTESLKEYLVDKQIPEGRVFFEKF